MHAAKVALIPRVDMSPERDGRVPIGQFVQDIIQFLAAVGRCELVERRAEDIGVGESKGVADFLVVALEETILDFINLIAAKSAIGRVQEDESVIGSIIIADYTDSELIERGLEQSAKQGPSIVGDVMVAYNRIEGQSCREDVVFVLAIDAIGSWVIKQGGVLIYLSILLEQGFKVFVHPFIGCIFYGYFCIIVILGLGVG